ncbi:MAG: UPF0175 family protein [Gammaproteobacteria bacterium]|nr:UPF0175 family protein [Gammaproteobacteria bacterium]
MDVVIEEDLLQAAHIPVQELKQEIALLLFQKYQLTLAQAARFAGMNRLEFQHLLAARKIPLHYSVEDFERDVATLQRLGRL